MVALLLSSACENLERRMAVKHNALGRSNEVVVVADEGLWESDLRDSLEYYFGAPYPVMPQPEPVFDLRHFSVANLQADVLRRELRTYIVVADLSDEDSPASKMTIQAIGEEAFDKSRSGNGYGTYLARDRWASGQLIFFLYGFGEDKLADAIREKYAAVATRIHEHDQVQIQAATYLNSTNRPIQDSLLKYAGVNMEIPGEYKLALVKEGTIWLRSEYTESSHNLIIKRLEYKDQQQLTEAYLRQMRDSISSAIVRTDTPGSIMGINDEDLPLLFYQKEINGNYTLEMRGVWEMSADYMGGPFTTKLIASPDRNALLYVDAWVYAPGKEKRDFVQRLEQVISSVRFP